VARLKALPWHDATRGAIGQLLARQVHALLLHGPAGIGKLDLALDTAEALLCEQRSADGAACGRCVGCTLMGAGNHPDLRIVRPEALAELDSRVGQAEDLGAGEFKPGATAAESRTRASREIRIEQIRDLSDWVTLTTHRGGPRVIVMEPVESLNAPSANALLKVLEEPPAGTRFLLVSHQLSETLPTLRSRCVLVRVPMPRFEGAARWLEQQGIAQPQRRLIEAGGAPLAAVGDERGGLAADLRDRLLALLRKGARLTPAELVAAVPRDVPVASAVALFQRWGWDFLAFSLAGAVRYYPDEVGALHQLGDKWQLTEACAWLQELRTARSFADHPLNAKLAIEGMLLSYLRSINGP
jgi:DNA polymerase-3 subunit delta'